VPSSGGAARPLLLASRSPRRAALLQAAGIPFEVADLPPVDERLPHGPGGSALEPEEAVRRLAERKARAAARAAPDRLVLAADTLVFLDGRPLGKPGSDGEARAMLRALSGESHEVATGVAVVRPGPGPVQGRLRSGTRVARVRFRRLTEAEIEAYVATGETRDKAGAYAIQGGAAAFVASLEGEADTVVGLPIGLVRSLLGPSIPGIRG
jgi:septum formation protein